MTHNLIHIAHVLTDDALLFRIQTLAARERSATAELVAHLAELESRDLHLAQGYSSLFAYCRHVLRLSEHEAYNRIEVARAARRFPGILDLLTSGAVTLTAVRLLAPHVTAENHRAVLESARDLSKLQVEELVARLRPRPDVPASIRKLPAKPARGPSRSAQSLPIAAPTGPTTAVAAAPPAAPAHAPVHPLAPDRYKLQLTISGSVLDKLREAQALLRHSAPSGDGAQILERALDALLTSLRRTKFATTATPRAEAAPARSQSVAARPSRHVPAPVRRAVHARDGGRCAFVGTQGRCGERAFLELHHVKPYVEGGLSTVDNIELRCRRHNDYEWRRRSHHVRAQEWEWQQRLAP